MGSGRSGSEQEVWDALEAEAAAAAADAHSCHHHDSRSELTPEVPQSPEPGVSGDDW